VPANDAIADMLDDLAKWTMKAGVDQAAFRAKALKKAAMSVRLLGYEITDGLSLGKGRAKLEGVGPSTAETIQAFIDTGKTHSARLEEMKQRAGG